jgi:hypothetical protein
LSWLPPFWPFAIEVTEVITFGALSGKLHANLPSSALHGFFIVGEKPKGHPPRLSGALELTRIRRT